MSTPLHILTVGISLLSNYERARGVERAKAVRQSAALADFLAADPCAASAEINALASRLGGWDRVGPGLRVALVYTQTAEGMAAAGALLRLLKRRGAAVAEIKLQGIDLPARKAAEPAAVSRAAREGLSELRRKVETHVRKARRTEPDLPVEFNVTGGFKAEVAVLYALGRDLGVPVYYMHETYRMAIDLPMP